jgi:hypothetical protein
MVVASDERDVTSDEDVIPKSDVALNDAARAKLDAFAKLHDLVRSPN